MVLIDGLRASLTNAGGQESALSALSVFMVTHSLLI
jgi:hypothetical protein|tara:strand:+ start:1741 stop:1848 length:108 start_codon:yes stop_codon:yes gene_type:complete